MKHKIKLPIQRCLNLTVSIIILLAVSSCQNVNVAEQSEEWKQDKIAALYQGYVREFPLVEGIGVKELQQLQQEGKEVVLVDVRSPEEIAVSIIPGAITQQEFAANIEQYKNSIVVAYCTIGYRSGKYADLWRQQGIRLLNLEGSLLAWSHSDGKLVNSKGQTNKVHVFSRQWQLIADDYQPVW